MKYVWLDLNSGKFSDSWDERTHQQAFSKDIGGDNLLNEAKEKGWKLIQYDCVNDEDFEFYNKMQLK